MSSAFTSAGTASPEQIFQVLGSRTRLRVLRALQGRELSVGELAESLRLTQSSASKHLALLKEAGLVCVRREGTWTFYQRAEGPPALGRVLREALESIEEAAADDAAVAAVVATRGDRSARFFSTVGEQWERIRQEYGGLAPVVHAVAGLVPRVEIALDVGTGAGHLLPILRDLARRVIALESTPAMLAEAVRATATGDTADVIFVRGDAQSLPLPDSAVDAVFASQVLRHVPHPSRALTEIGRVLRPGGTCVVIDLCEHQEEWLREERGHLWLGFARASLARWMEQAGLTLRGYRVVQPEPGRPAARRMPSSFVAHAMTRADRRPSP